MNSRSFPKSTVCITALTLGMTVGIFLPSTKASLNSVLPVAVAATSFPDTQGYWGQPFIRVLAERDIVTGYLDSTYRPEQPVARDEFAAILRQAFSQEPERRISSGSVYVDVPEGYWAAPAIQNAYEMGFMHGYPGGEFRPNQPVTKAEALVSLAQNLDLSAPAAQDAAAQDPASQTASAAAPQQPAQESAQPSTQQSAQQPVSRRRSRQPLMFPLAMTTLMQPLIQVVQATPAQTPAAGDPPSDASASAPAATPDPSQSAVSTLLQRPVSLMVSEYYDDAAQIPYYAVGGIARATEAGIVVNHPNPRLLNPNQPVSRGEMAALIHQALVHQGRLDPLPADETAANYIVGH